MDTVARLGRHSRALYSSRMHLSECCSTWLTWPAPYRDFRITRGCRYPTAVQSPGAVWTERLLRWCWALVATRTVSLLSSSKHLFQALDTVFATVFHTTVETLIKLRWFVPRLRVSHNRDRAYLLNRTYFHNLNRVYLLNRACLHNLNAIIGPISTTLIGLSPQP